MTLACLPDAPATDATIARPTADQVADAIVYFCHDHGIPLTPPGLQTLLYYTQAWHLALQGEAMFDGEFEAWARGPVHRPTWERFRHLPQNAVIADEPDFPPDGPAADPCFGGDSYWHVTDVMMAYSHLSAYELELTVHQERPYVETRAGCGPLSPCGEVISERSMRDFYAAQLAAREAARPATGEV